MPRPCRACRWSYGCFVVPKCTATHDDGVTFCWKICAKCEAAFCLNFYLFKRTKVLCISVLYTSNSELLPLKYLLHILSIAYYRYFDRSFIGQSGCYETLSNSVERPGATKYCRHRTMLQRGWDNVFQTPIAYQIRQPPDAITALFVLPT